MCQYYGYILYNLCGHRVSSAPLPLHQCFLLAECPAQQAARQSVLPTGPRFSSNESLNNWRARLHERVGNSNSNSSSSTPHTLHPCFVVDFVASETCTVRAPEDDSVDLRAALCAACRAELQRRNAAWAHMLDAVVAASNAAAAGRYAAAAPPDYHESLARLPGDMAAQRAPLERLRAAVLGRRGPDCVFRGLWSELRAYERLLVAAVLFARPHVPDWRDYPSAWSLNRQRAAYLRDGLNAVVAEGEQLLAAAAAPSSAPSSSAASPLLPMSAPRFVTPRLLPPQAMPDLSSEMDLDSETAVADDDDDEGENEEFFHMEL